MVCLGEALVDLVCERPAAGPGAAEAFVPRPGGSLANIAAAAARFGADVELLGTIGGDEWEGWIRRHLDAENIAHTRLLAVEGAATSLAFVTVSVEREPSYAFHGDERRADGAADLDLEAALAGEGVLVVGSDTLVGTVEREVTMRAVQLARARGWGVLADPNLRPNRWASEAEMLARIGAMVDLATVVKCNADEALALTGAIDPIAAARALAGGGAAIVTRGADGAIWASPESLQEVAAPAASELVDATGAGDSVAGVMAAALALGLDPDQLGAALPVAMETAARVVASWGATEGLPAAEHGRASLAQALNLKAV